MRADPIVFKCESSLWDMMASGEKTFDMRRFDTADNRIQRLRWGSARDTYAVISRSHKVDEGSRLQLDRRMTAHEVTIWEPEVEAISFINKVTGDTLTFRYRSMEFADWAPGFCFLLLGERVEA